MKTIFYDPSVTFTSSAVATIGFFDGVHRGHCHLLSRVAEEARAVGMESMVVTFDRHPRQVLQPDWRPELLSTLDEKLRRLSETAVDVCVVLPFSKALSMLSAQQFMADVLQNRLHVKRLVMGYDSRFGHNRAEGFADYVRYGQALGMAVEQAEALVVEGQAVSSSRIRACLRAGDVSEAAQLLGRDYVLQGRVVNGFHEGHRLGFPTANLDAAQLEQLVPANGVYAVRASVGENGPVMLGMTNIGTRPTFHGQGVSVETHLFDFEKDIYGERLSIAFAQRIRSEQKFESEAALAEQLRKDKEFIINYL